MDKQRAGEVAAFNVVCACLCVCVLCVFVCGCVLCVCVVHCCHGAMIICPPIY